MLFKNDRNGCLEENNRVKSSGLTIKFFILLAWLPLGAVQGYTTMSEIQVLKSTVLLNSFKKMDWNRMQFFVQNAVKFYHAIFCKYIYIS